MMSEAYYCYYWFLSVYHLCAIVAVMLVRVEWYDEIDVIANVTVNVHVIALMAFDVVVVDSKLKHSIGYWSLMNLIPNLVLNSVCVTNRYSVIK